MSERDLRGELRENEPLARHTSWRVGGPARRFYRPADIEDLAAFLGRLDPDEPLLWLGLGSNLLVDDAGFPGTVIQTQGALKGLALSAERDGLYAEAGVASAQAARFAIRHDLVGIEFLAGIPGTLGGALAMNAGAWGGETWSSVTQVRTIDRFGQLRIRTPADYVVGYRQVQGPPGEWFVACELRLAPGDGAAARARIAELLVARARRQPVGLPSCGSVFRNPAGDHAARLIEGAGLKGRRIGGAEVSAKHANFIINTGGASARDIRALMQLVQDEVERTAGVRLVPEVHQVGGDGE
jgi:UDP-N-acetylmuramate dehydrogenase